MNGRIVVRILLVLVLIAAALGIGVYVYNAGFAQGLVESGKLVAPAAGAVPYFYGPWFYRPFGFGFGLLGCLFPLLFFLLFFGLLRGFFWRGGWGGPRGYWGRGVPPMFEEWHRQAHEATQTPEPQK